MNRFTKIFRTDWRACGLTACRWLAAGAGLIGAVTLLLWAFSSNWPPPDSFAWQMKGVTAFAIVLMSLSALLSTSFLGRKAAIGAACGFLAGAIGVIALIESAGIDVFMGRWALWEAAGSPMSPHTALILTIFGGALATARARGSVSLRVSGAFLVATGVLVLLAAAGYLHDAPRLYGVSQAVRLSPQSVVAFTLLWAAMMSSRIATGGVPLLSGHGEGSAAARALTPAVIVIPIVVGWLRKMGDQQGFFSTQYLDAVLLVLLVAVLVVTVGVLAKKLNALEQQRDAERARRRELEASIGLPRPPTGSK